MNEITREWLDFFQDRKANGDRLADSIFWRLAVDVLPLGVDPDHPEVKAAIEEIRQSIAAREQQ